MCNLLFFPAHAALAEKGHFAFVTIQQAADVLVVGKNNQECSSYCEDAVAGFRLVKDEQYEYRESYAGTYGAKRYITGNEQHEQEDANKADGYQWLDGQYHTEEAGNAFTTTEIGPNREDMADDGYKTQDDLQVDQLNGNNAGAVIFACKR